MSHTYSTLNLVGTKSDQCVVESFEGLGDVGLLWVSQRCYGAGGGNDSDCVCQVLRVRGSFQALWARQLSHNSLRGFGKYNQSLADYKAE